MKLFSRAAIVGVVSGFFPTFSLHPTHNFQLNRMSRVISSLPFIAEQSVSFINSSTAKSLDDTLMSSPGFSLDTLMELAGYSVSCAANDYLTNVWIEKPQKSKSKKCKQS